jgi:hypothetical protein
MKMNQTRVERTISYVGAVTVILILTGILTVSAVTLGSAKAQSGDWLADLVITIVNLFIKLVLMIA